MRILFDQGTPVPLRRELAGGHVIETVYERGWATLKNGVLLSTAEQAGYDVLITTDQQLHYQQNLSGRRLAILVLGTTSWPRIRAQVPRVQAALDICTPGSYHEVAFHPTP